MADLILEDDVPEISRSTLTDRVRTHAELRHEQGYSLHRLLSELNTLRSTVCDATDDLVASRPETSPGDVHAVHRSLHREFGRIGEEAARIYTETEAEERRQIAERLTNFGRALEHEIRGPLQKAAVAVEGLEDSEVREDPERHRRYVEVLDGELERVTDLLAETRRLTLVEETLGEEKRVPLRRMVRDVFDELEEMAESRDVELREGDLADDVLVTVPRLRLAVRNLVANAIKYSDPGRSDPHVEVSLRRSPSEGACRIVVEDNGLGVPEEFRERIFEPGVRAHPETGSGTGLGLAIVQQLLEQRRGAVWVEPVPEGGSRFVLDLPVSLARSEV